MGNVTVLTQPSLLVKSDSPYHRHARSVLTISSKGQERRRCYAISVVEIPPQASFTVGDRDINAWVASAKTTEWRVYCHPLKGLFLHSLDVDINAYLEREHQFASNESVFDISKTRLIFEKQPRRGVLKVECGRAVGDDVVLGEEDGEKVVIELSKAVVAAAFKHDLPEVRPNVLHVHVDTSTWQNFSLPTNNYEVYAPSVPNQRGKVVIKRCTLRAPGRVGQQKEISACVETILDDLMKNPDTSGLFHQRNIDQWSVFVSAPRLVFMTEIANSFRAAFALSPTKLKETFQFLWMGSQLDTKAPSTRSASNEPQLPPFNLALWDNFFTLNMAYVQFDGANVAACLEETRIEFPARRFQLDVHDEQGDGNLMPVPLDALYAKIAIGWYWIGLMTSTEKIFPKGPAKFVKMPVRGQLELKSRLLLPMQTEVEDVVGEEGAFVDAPKKKGRGKLRVLCGSQEVDFAGNPIKVTFVPLNVRTNHSLLKKQSSDLPKDLR